MRKASSILKALEWGLFIAILVAVFYKLTPEHLLFTDDAAFSFALARQDFWPLSGHPSHLEGRHFGPLWLWVVKLAWLLSGGQIYLATLLLTCVKLLSIPLGLLFLRIAIPNTSWQQYSRVVFLLLIFSSASLEYYRIDWLPYFLPLPITLFLLSLALLYRFGWAWFPVFILSSALALQPHPTTLPFLAASIIPLVFISIGKPYEARACPRILQIASLLTAVLLWLPVLYYELAFEANIFHTFFSNAPSNPGAFHLFSNLPAIFRFIDEAILPLSGWVALFVASAFGFFLTLRKRNNEDSLSLRILLSFFGMAVFSGLLYLLALSKQEEIHSYYFISLAPLLFLLLSMSIGKLLSYFLNQEKGYLKILITCLSSAALVFLVFYSRPLQRWNWSFPLPVYTSMAHAKSFVELLKKHASQEDFHILVRGTSQHRANAYLFFLKKDRFPYFLFSNRVLECPSCQDKPELPQKAFLITCFQDHPPTDKFLGRLEGRKRLKKYTIVKEIDVSSLGIAGLCRAHELKKQ